jgi:hypothetical protein
MNVTAAAEASLPKRFGAEKNNQNLKRRFAVS